jgi:amidase
MNQEAGEGGSSRRAALGLAAVVAIAAAAVFLVHRGGEGGTPDEPFHLQEATIEEVHRAIADGELTARQLVQLYLDRIDAYDRQGPRINSVITVNPRALEEADRLDAAFRESGLVGPLHGIPVLLKDQMDARGMPTTLGSILFRDYRPDRDAFVTEKLEAAGAIILGKVTLGELAGGDAHGSLFGSTRNPYDPSRTPGGSSGGSGASVAANFAMAAVGQENFASIRRPAAWNSLVGMRPTIGLVSGGGVYSGWPMTNGTLGPLARTVADVARMLDAMVGYDPEDPLTAWGIGHAPASFASLLDRNGLMGARIGVLRESMGRGAEPGTEDFEKVTAVFDRAIGELKAAGAVVVDPIVIPGLAELLAKRVDAPGALAEAFQVYFRRSADPPFESLEAMVRSPDFAKVAPFGQSVVTRPTSPERYHEFLLAREQLMTHVLKVMADHDLDAIVYKGMEHQPTLIEDGVNPPFVSAKGAPHLNTYLSIVPAIVVPAGFTSDNLPVGITFQGRPYEDGIVLKLAYAYEQATHHRRPPVTTPPLPGEP